MPLDRRLRGGVDRLTSQVDPDIERNLHGAVRRARRTIVLRRVGIAIAILASIVVAIAVVPRTLGALGGEQHRRPAASEIPTQTNPSIIAGTYRADIPNDQTAIRQNGLAGRWTFGLDANGVMTPSAPPSYPGPRSGYTFQISGDRFRTDLFSTSFCSGVPPGVYRWGLSDASLTFTPIDDRCAARADLLGARSWRSARVAPLGIDSATLAGHGDR